MGGQKTDDASSSAKKLTEEKWVDKKKVVDWNLKEILRLIISGVIQGKTRNFQKRDPSLMTI